MPLRTLVPLPCRPHRRARVSLVLSMAVLLSGCWAPPSASLRPGSRSRVIERAIEVESPIPGGSRAARVLVVDPSYRVLTVQYPNGGTQTFKVPLGTRISDIQAGDSVTIRAAEGVGPRVR